MGIIFKMGLGLVFFGESGRQQKFYGKQRKGKNNSFNS
ncbi:hypothetical protein SGRA_2625 [Saprospira grandis str. Lewin]|uniref:Uncharacterized protein n=1 Tax=Saprospira grandis (strain Lewin) TaxID=984262 RepID=H6L825_SAPGL|nr:hypothetical protein SGRA_2625 [Saprospira grandis str. Lewin]